MAQTSIILFVKDAEFCSQLLHKTILKAGKEVLNPLLKPEDLISFSPSPTPIPMRLLLKLKAPSLLSVCAHFSMKRPQSTGFPRATYTLTLKLQALELLGHLDSGKALGRPVATNSSGTQGPREALGLNQFPFSWRQRAKSVRPNPSRRESEVDMGIDGVVMFSEDWRGSQTHDWRGPISILEG